MFYCCFNKKCTTYKFKFVWFKAKNDWSSIYDKMLINQKPPPLISLGVQLLTVSHVFLLLKILKRLTYSPLVYLNSISSHSELKISEEYLFPKAKRKNHCFFSVLIFFLFFFFITKWCMTLMYICTLTFIVRLASTQTEWLNDTVYMHEQCVVWNCMTLHVLSSSCKS